MNQLRTEGLGYALDSPEYMIRFSIENVRPLGKFTVGWVLVESIEGNDPAFLVQGTYSVDDPNDENKLVRELFYHSKETRAMGQTVWKEMVRCFFGAVYQRERHAVAFTKIGRLDTSDTEVELVQDLITRGDPTILYGRGGNTKGVLATALCVCLSLGHTFAGLKVANAVPMYLDWEDNPTRLNARVQQLCRGMEVSQFPEISYLRCSRPLAQILPAIMRQRDHDRADFLVVDSWDPACGFEGAWNERSGRAFDALRVLDMTTLIIAHSSKASFVAKGDNRQDASVFGSIMNENRARSIWRVDKDQEKGSPTAVVTLHHEKINGGRLQQPMAFELSWAHKGEIRIGLHIPWENAANKIKSIYNAV